MFKSLYRIMIGKPLDSHEAEGERIPKWKALPIFSSDALSSVGYGPEQIALVLAAVPALGLYAYFGAIVIAIIILLGIVALSYSQVIKANPGGGGSYAIAMKYLGVYPALTAGAALFSDYILTVAVSICSGTAALTSAFPILGPFHLYIDIFVLVGVLMIFNLRGVQEASNLFVWPTYIFLIAMFATILGGLYQVFVLGVLPTHVVNQNAEPITAMTGLLLLRAFANGCSSMTGVEAIADGVPLFKAPQERNAMVTTVIMASILACMLGGLGYLFIYFQLVPVEGITLMSILVEEVFGRTTMFYFIQLATMVILYLAANTAFNGLPPLLSFMARDGYVPRYLGNRGERLSFSNGIILLTLAAASLIIVFEGSVEHLISLYAVGVFLSFTIAQSAMVVHWKRSQNKGWHINAFINGLGAVVTACVVIIVLITKFMYGAWIVCLLIPLLVYVFLKIHRHYEDVREQLLLTPEAYQEYMKEEVGRNLVIIPVASPTQAVAKAIFYAKATLGANDKIYAVHVCTDEIKGEKVKRLWQKLEPSIEMVLIPSPYRQLSSPLVNFILRLRNAKNKNDLITVLIPEFETKKMWHRLLHNQSGMILRARMLSYIDVVVITVPFKFTR
jgi:amino acid transporter